MNFGSLNEFLEYSMNKENLKMDLKEKILPAGQIRLEAMAAVGW
jgi:hypothetical protein